MNDPEINTKAYWDLRFADDWDSNLGREQSRFFGEIAVKLMPHWLQEAIRGQGWSICDWGCAEGDGTYALAEAFPGNKVVGIDFSDIAIAAARVRYGARFATEDWVAPDQRHARQDWDLVFSSNTLEHFRDPAAVLSRLCRRAAKGVVLLLPYKELERHHEHETTFLASNIPLVAREGVVLCYTATLDASLEKPSYWGGEQVLLVYLRIEVAAALGLTAQEAVLCLSDDVVSVDFLRRDTAELALKELQGQLHQLQQELDNRQHLIDSLAEEESRKPATNEELAFELDRLHKLIEEKDHDLGAERERVRALTEAIGGATADARRQAQRRAQVEEELAAIHRNPLRLLRRKR